MVAGLSERTGTVGPAGSAVFVRFTDAVAATLLHTFGLVCVTELILRAGTVVRTIGAVFT